MTIDNRKSNDTLAKHAKKCLAKHINRQRLGAVLNGETRIKDNNSLVGVHFTVKRDARDVYVVEYFFDHSACFYRQYLSEIPSYVKEGLCFLMGLKNDASDDAIICRLALL